MTATPPDAQLRRLEATTARLDERDKATAAEIGHLRSAVERLEGRLWKMVAAGSVGAGGVSGGVVAITQWIGG